jgi:hypothetical protein
LAAGAVLAGAAEARPFVALKNGANAWTLIDPATIEMLPDGVRRTWTVTVQRNILDGDPPQPGYVRTLNEYDCVRQTARWLRLSVFSRTGGQLVSQENASADWLPASASGETLVALRVACGQSQGDSVFDAGNIGSLVIALMQGFDAVQRPVAPPMPAPAPAPKR